MDAHLLGEIRRVFAAADQNGNGRISGAELGGLMTQINGGRRPSDVEISQALASMDTDGDGAIALDEFTTAMSRWLLQVRATDPGSPTTTSRKRKLEDSHSDPPGNRKRIQVRIRSFFEQFAPRESLDELAMKLFSRAQAESVDDAIDLDAWRGDFYQYSPEQKAQLLDEVKQLKQDARGLVRDIQSGHIDTVFRAVCATRTLLKIAEVFQAPSERLSLAHELFEIFEGVTAVVNPPILATDGKPLGPIIFRTVQLLDLNIVRGLAQDGVDPSRQFDLIAACLECLSIYLLGPRVPHMPESNKWHVNHMYAKTILFPLGIIDRLYGIVSASGLPTHVQIQSLKCLSVFAESNADALKIVLERGFVPKVLEYLHPGNDLAVLTAAAQALAVMVGHTHGGLPARPEWGEIRRILGGVWPLLNMANSENPELRARTQSPQYEMLVINLALCTRFLLPLVDALPEGVLQTIVRLLNFSWTTERGGKIACCALLVLIRDLASDANEAQIQAIVSTEDLSSTIGAQLRLSQNNKEIISNAITVLHAVGSHAEGAEFLHPHLHQIYALLQNPSLCVARRAIRLLNAFASQPSNVNALLESQVTRSAFLLLGRFKERDDVLQDVYGFMGPSFNMQLVHNAILLLNTLVSHAKGEILISLFGLDEVEKITSLHQEICKEILLTRLSPDSDVMALDGDLKRLLKQIGDQHLSHKSSVNQAMQSFVTNSLMEWDKTLAAAVRANPSSNPNGMELEDAKPMGTALHGYVDIAAVAPLRGSGPLYIVRVTADLSNTEDSRLFKVPRDVELGQLCSYVSSLFGFAAALQVEDPNAKAEGDIHAPPLVRLGSGLSKEAQRITLDNAGQLEALFAAHDHRTATSPELHPGSTPLQLYVLPQTSTFGTTPAAASARIGMGPKEAELLSLVASGVRLNKKFLEDIYEYFRRNKTQALDFNGFKEMLRNVEPNEQIVGQLFHAFDVNKDNQLSFNEVAVGFSVIMEGSLEERLGYAFKAFDADGSGTLDFSELVQLIKFSKSNVSENTARSFAVDIFLSVDKDQSGTLDFNEFQMGVKHNTIILSHFWMNGFPGLQTKYKKCVFPSVKQ